MTIDPRDFGRLEEKVDNLSTSVANLADKVDKLVEAKATEKGMFQGWKTGAKVTALVIASGGSGTAIAKLLEKLI